MTDANLLLLLVLLPFAGSVAASMLPSNARNAEAWLSGLVALVAFTITAMMYPLVRDGGVLRQARPVRPLSRQHPEAAIPAMDAKWYRLGNLDSVVVSMKDQTGAAFYQRDPEVFRDLLKRSTAIHERLYREWPQLAETYRSQLATVVSPERWAQTFGIPAEDEH